MTSSVRRRRRGKGFIAGFAKGLGLDGLRFKAGHAAGQAAKRRVERRRGAKSAVFSGRFVKASSGRVAGKKPRFGSTSVRMGGAVRPTAGKAASGRGAPAPRREAERPAPLVELGKRGAVLVPRGEPAWKRYGFPSPEEWAAKCAEWDAMRAAGRTKPPGDSLRVDSETGIVECLFPEAPPVRASGTTSTTRSTTTGGRGTVSGWDMLSEAPATDADHLQKLTEIAGNLQGGADAVAEYAQVCQSAGMDQRALGRLQNLAESLAEAGSHVGGAVEEFEQTYGPVRELAAAGVSIPGDEGKFWTGEGA